MKNKFKSLLILILVILFAVKLIFRLKGINQDYRKFLIKARKDIKILDNYEVTKKNMKFKLDLNQDYNLLLMKDRSYTNILKDIYGMEDESFVINKFELMKKTKDEIQGLDVNVREILLDIRVEDISFLEKLKTLENKYNNLKINEYNYLKEDGRHELRLNIKLYEFI